MLLLSRALADDEGLVAQRVEVDDEAIEALASAAGGDARIALNALEMAVASAPAAKGGPAQ